jgi:large repetitive protein
MQMAEALRDRGRLASIHILAHGQPGEVSFDAGPLSLETMGEQATELAAIGRALGEDGDLRLWSCQTGEGERGAGFVDALARATHAQVAGSTRRVGVAALGGRWELDACCGGAKARAPLTAEGMAAYAGVMAAKSWKGGNGNWSSAANWIPSGVPGTNDDVQIQASGNYTVALDVNSANLDSLTINSSKATLAIGATTLTVKGSGTNATDAVNVTSGHITIAGGTLNAGAVLLSSGTDLIGRGTINATLSGTGSVTAKNGGTLDLTGAVDSGLTLTIDAGAANILKLDGMVTTTSAIAISDVNQTLEIGPTGSLTISSSAESITAGTIQLDGGTLSDSAGITIGNRATLTGKGTVAGVLKGTGNAVINASGGTLDLTGTVTGSSSLRIDTTPGSTLKIDGIATSGGIAINNVNQILEIGSSGDLTISAAESITNGKIQLDGGKLTDTGGITLGAGARLTGYGMITTGVTASTDFDGPGSVMASGGVLEFRTSVDSATTTAFDIANVAGSVLKFDGAVGTASIHPTIKFDGANGSSERLDLSSTTLANFNAIVANFAPGEGIIISGAASAQLDGTGKILTVSDGSHNSLGTIALATSYTGDSFPVSGNTVMVTVGAALSVSISGTAQEGATLTAVVTTTDTVHYQWQLSDGHGGWTNIGTDNAAYFVQESDEGQSIRVTANTSTASATSAATAAVIDQAPSLTTPVISGTAQEGQTLSATAALSNEPSETTITYQWQADHGAGFSNLTGETGLSHLVTEADEGATLRIVATSTDPDGNGTSATSAATAAVIDQAPSLTTPVISGTAQEGQTLSATAALSNEPSETTITYQWQADHGSGFVNIPGATGTSYTLTWAEENATIRVVAASSDPDGSGTTAASAATGPVVDIGPFTIVWNNPSGGG